MFKGSYYSFVIFYFNFVYIFPVTSKVKEADLMSDSKGVIDLPLPEEELALPVAE